MPGELDHRNHVRHSGLLQGSGISGWESESERSSALGTDGARRMADDSRVNRSGHTGRCVGWETTRDGT